MISRRLFLASTAAGFWSLLPNGAFHPLAAHAASETDASDAAGAVATELPSFTFEALVETMQARAGEPYAPYDKPLPEALANLDYDHHRLIKFRRDRSLWSNTAADYQLQAFHPGWLFKEPVEVFEIIDGHAKPVTFSGADFEYLGALSDKGLEKMELPGAAGIRLLYPLNTPDNLDELIVFLGASYFRALGKGNTYGLSARGLAVNTAAGGAEEFPRFSRFYLRRPEEGQQEMLLWAELDSPSVTGAFQFRILPDINTQVEVDARLFVRNDIERLGIAPLTSMYLFGENDRTGFDDYRPEVHDSDGLLILREDGERLWRPLRNPSNLGLSFLGESNPQGFGLLQRDRKFDDYQDTEALYHKRPSLWIEPMGDWGQGSVMLAEIPSQLEVHDNIVAFWVPEAKAEAGSSFRFAYRMTWGAEPEPGTEKAQVVATRTGHGGASGLAETKATVRKFVVEFAGEQLAKIGAEEPLSAILSIQNGEQKTDHLQKLEGGGWRYVFDVQRNNADQPVEMHLVLKLNDKILTERWMYQWTANT
ncbi:glucan biosynthesis protein [Roseibium sp. CAU 1637]|uniref:Glucan biosynthesis protein n=1 Tax=Roseibium limicola TaxID=2816037 RepID=A0A939J4G1_9HYPH|nr:glucan biosynthesis protein [Roseibium limicola]